MKVFLRFFLVAICEQDGHTCRVNHFLALVGHPLTLCMCYDNQNMTEDLKYDHNGPTYVSEDGQTSIARETQIRLKLVGIRFDTKDIVRRCCLSLRVLLHNNNNKIVASTDAMFSLLLELSRTTTLVLLALNLYAPKPPQPVYLLM
jgi:hypothetical protein